MADPLGLMQPQQDPGMGMAQDADMGMVEGGDSGKSYKDILTESLQQVPIDQLIKLVQSMSKEELAQKIQQMLIQSGKSEDVAISLSITIMKVIFERIQNETGRPVSEIMQQPQGPTQAPQPPSVMNAPQGGQNAQPV